MSMWHSAPKRGVVVRSLSLPRPPPYSQLYIFGFCYFVFWLHPRLCCCLHPVTPNHPIGTGHTPRPTRGMVAGWSGSLRSHHHYKDIPSCGCLDCNHSVNSAALAADVFNASPSCSSCSCWTVIVCSCVFMSAMVLVASRMFWSTA